MTSERAERKKGAMVKMKEEEEAGEEEGVEEGKCGVRDKQQGEEKEGGGRGELVCTHRPSAVSRKTHNVMLTIDFRFRLRLPEEKPSQPRAATCIIVHFFYFKKFHKTC